MPIKQVINFHSRLVFSKAESALRRVKGFVSMNVEDRGGDVVPAEEFNIERFMAVNPSVMVNHEFWIDERGNKIVAGVAKDLFVARVRDIGDDDLFGIEKVETGEMMDTFPRKKAPEVSPGDVGLWGLAEITSPEIWKRIEDGEFNAFSWRGFVDVDFLVDENSGEQVRVMRNIDIVEFSVVNIPQNQRAAFTIAKALENSTDLITEKTEKTEGPLIVQSLRFEKSVFKEKEDVQKWLEAKNFESDNIQETDDAWFSIQRSTKDFQNETLLSINMSEGVQAIAGKMTPEAEKRNAKGLVGDITGKKLSSNSDPAFVLAKILSSSDLQSIRKLELQMAEEIKKEETTEEAPVVETPKEETKEEVKEETDDSLEKTFGGNEQAKAAINLVSETVAKSVAETLAPAFEGIAKGLEALGEVIKNMNIKTETIEKEETTEEKSKFEKSLGLLSSLVTDLNNEVENVKKKQELVSKTLPNQEEREEVLKTEEGKKKDKNAVFDTLNIFG